MAASRERQLSLFLPGFEALERAKTRAASLGAGRAAVVPRDPNVAGIAEKRRLSGQNAAILARLRQGPATNAELAAISLKYTSRNSDLRRAGYPVEVISRDRKTGVVVYALISDPDVDPQGQGV
jgi:hypothetical protein